MKELREQRISREDVLVYLEDQGIGKSIQELTIEQMAALRFEIKVNPEKIRFASSRRRRSQSGRTLDDELKDLF